MTHDSDVAMLQLIKYSRWVYNFVGGDTKNRNHDNPSEAVGESNGDMTRHMTPVSILS